MMSGNTWISFFKDAGIPSPLAENYGALFEDNRITRHMLLDLNKEILQDIGITVIGDIIAILKHAKKAHQMTLKNKSVTTTTSSKKVAVAPLSTTSNTSTDDTGKDKEGGKTKASPPRKEPVQSLPPPPPPPPPKLPLIVDPPSDVQYTTTTYDSQKQQQQQQHSIIKDISGGTMRSDFMVPQPKIEPSQIIEEYTTATYEAQMMKRTAAPPPTKLIKMGPDTSSQERIVILPSSSLSSGEGEERGGIERSKRFLEAAGCFSRSGLGEISSQKHSVFSRLELPVVQQSPHNKPHPRVTPITSNVKSRLGKRESSPPSSPPSRIVKPHLYSDVSPSTQESNTVTSPSSSIHSRLGNKQELTSVGHDICTPTMVADTISKHSDVHARLTKKGLTVLPTKRGPLGKRLGEHAVFNRLW